MNDRQHARATLPHNPRDLERIAADAYRIADGAETIVYDGAFCSLAARPEHPNLVVDGGPVFVVVPGELVELSHMLAPYGVPTLAPVQHPARLHPEGGSIDLESKLHLVDGRASVSGPPPRAVVARVGVEVARDAAKELAQVAEERIADLGKEQTTGTASPPSGMLSARELAETNGVDPERLRKALERWRHKNLDDGWREVNDRRSREPRYLYDPVAVELVLARLRSA